MTTPIDLAANLTQRRDDIRRLLGDGYTNSIEPWRRVIRQLSSARPDEPIAQLVLAEGRRIDAAGYDPSYLFAAFVDECEQGFIHEDSGMRFGEWLKVREV